VEELRVRANPNPPARAILPQPTTPTGHAKIEEIIKKVVVAINTAIEQRVPSSRSCARSVPVWTRDVKKA
jgi:hypothetical protein